MAPGGPGVMQDTELYRNVLGLEKPWKVDYVDLDIRGGRVDVWMAAITPGVSVLPGVIENTKFL